MRGAWRDLILAGTVVGLLYLWISTPRPARGDAVSFVGVEVIKNRGVAGGYAPLDSNNRVPTAHLGSGAPGLDFLRGDQTWAAAGGGSGVPSGAVVLITSGSCPAGFSEAADLNGVMVRGTIAANGDVGTSGGNDTVTPAGTNVAPTFAGNALAGHSHVFTGSALSAHAHGVGAYVASAPTFTGNALSGHSHAVGTYAADGASAGTPAGTLAWPAQVPTQAGHTHNSHTTSAAGSGGAQKVNGPTTHSSEAPVISWPAQVPVFTGSAMSNHGHAVSGSSQSVSAGTPSGTNSAPAMSGASESVSAGTPSGLLDSVSGGTPSGSVSAPAFTGSPLDNRPAFVRAIFCRKT